MPTVSPLICLQIARPENCGRYIGWQNMKLGAQCIILKFIIKSKLLWPLECSKVLLPLLVGGRLDGGCLTILYNRHVDHSLGA